MKWNSLRELNEPTGWATVDCFLFLSHSSETTGYERCYFPTRNSKGSNNSIICHFISSMKQLLTSSGETGDSIHLRYCLTTNYIYICRLNYSLTRLLKDHSKEFRSSSGKSHNSVLVFFRHTSGIFFSCFFLWRGTRSMILHVSALLKQTKQLPHFLVPPLSSFSSSS